MLRLTASLRLGCGVRDVRVKASCLSITVDFDIEAQNTKEESHFLYKRGTSRSCIPCSLAASSGLHPGLVPGRILHSVALRPFPALKKNPKSVWTRSRTGVDLPRTAQPR